MEYRFDQWQHGLPKVSCLCPTFGRPHLLGEAIESFLRQDYPGARELIILNDHPSLPIIVPDLPDIIVINSHIRFSSLGCKRNKLAEYSSGDLLFPWDDDDISFPWRISETVDRMKNLHYFKPRDLWWWDGITYRYTSETNAHAMAGYSATLFKQVGGYPNMNSGEDLEFERKIRYTGLLQGEELGPEYAFYLYRMDPNVTYHISNSEFGSGWEECASYVNAKFTPGACSITPSWKEDYVSRIADMSNQQREAR